MGDYGYRNVALVKHTAEHAATAFLFAFGYYAFSCVMLISVWADLPSRTITVPYRALFLLGSLGIIIWRQPNRPTMPYCGYFLLLLPFWLITELRIVLAWTESAPFDQANYSDLLLRSFLMCFIPMIAFWREYDLRAYRTGFKALVLFGGLASLVATWFYREAFSTGVGRLRKGSLVGDVEALSPLALSYLGSSMIVLGMAIFLETGLLKNRLVGKFVPWIIIAVGVPPFLLGTSRGSVLAILGCSFVLLIARLKKGRIRKAVVWATFVAFLGCVLIYTAAIAESSVLERFFSIVRDVEAGESSAVRLPIWKNSLELFLRSPLWGGV